MAQIYQSNLRILYTIEILKYVTKCRQNPFLNFISRRLIPWEIKFCKKLSVTKNFFFCMINHPSFSGNGLPESLLLTCIILFFAISVKFKHLRIYLIFIVSLNRSSAMYRSWLQRCAPQETHLLTESKC